jgi:hypothetical protein
MAAERHKKRVRQSSGVTLQREHSDEGTEPLDDRALQNP